MLEGTEGVIKKTVNRRRTDNRMHNRNKPDIIKKKYDSNAII
jgi:hypothetical protein